MHDKKSEILNEALRLFKEKGYDNVTVNEIAGASHISKNTFYYYYESKEELICTFFDPSMFEKEKIMAELLKYSDPYEQILCLFGMIANYFMYLDKEVVRRALVMNLSRDLFPKKREIADKTFVPVISLFERAVKEKRVRQDVPAEKLLRSCGTILIGCLQIWATNCDEMDLNAIIKEGIQIVLKD